MTGFPVPLGLGETSHSGHLCPCQTDAAYTARPKLPHCSSCFRYEPEDHTRVTRNLINIKVATK